MSVRKIARYIHGLGQVPSVSHLVLWHLSVSQRKSQVARHDEWEDADDLASTVYEEARNTAAAFPGPQSYMLTAHDKEDRDSASPLATMGFRVDATEGGALAGEHVGSEPPTSEGLQAQLMRHIENKERTINSMFGSVISYLVRDNEKKSEQLDALLATRLEMVKTMEELAGEKHIRDLEWREQEEGAARKKELFEKIMQYVPVAINKLSGQELVRQKDTELELVAQEFVRGLSTSQLDALRDSGLMKSPQLLLLGTMLEKVATRMVTTEQATSDSRAATELATTVPAERKSTP